MRHPILDLIDRREGKKTTPCNDKCVNWQFPHLDCACVLSSVYSVNKGEPCYEFKPKEVTQ